MKRKTLLRRLMGVTFMMLLGARIQADPADVANLAIGERAPDFRLPGVDGKDHALKDYDHSKVLVVAFTCNH